MPVSTVTSTTIISNLKAGEEDEISYKKLNKLYFLFISPFKCVSIKNFVPNEKMLNITHYQRNANQNHNEVPSHTGQNGCTLLVGMQTSAATMENSVEIP